MQRLSLRYHGIVREITSAFGILRAWLARRKNEGRAGLNQDCAMSPRGMHWKPKADVASRTFLLVCVFIFGLTGTLAVQSGKALAAQSALFARGLNDSELQRWMTKELLPYLAFEFAHHPRFKGQKIQLMSDAGNGLTAAIQDSIQTRLEDIKGLQLVSESVPDSFNPAGLNDIDDMVCVNQGKTDYILRLSVTNWESSRVEVRVSVEDVEAATIISGFGKHWRGRLSREERALSRSRQAAGPPLGTSDRPYLSLQPEQAARHLALYLACGWRANIDDNLKIHWRAPASSSPAFDKTLTIARHYLHSFKELSQAPDAQKADIVLRPQERSLGDGLHQFWLAAKPGADSALPAIDAVTYMSIADRGDAAIQKHPVDIAGATEGVPARERDERRQWPAQNALQVNVVGIKEQPRRGGVADILLTLTINNRATLPIDYSFTLAGGYFIGCVADERNFRREGSGSLRDSINPRESQVKTLVIRHLRHDPLRRLAARKCAGVVDLDGFQQFERRGRKVTDYIKWSSTQTL